MGYFSAVYAFHEEPNWKALSSVAPALSFLALCRTSGPLWLLTCRERGKDEPKFPLAYFPEGAVENLTEVNSATCLPPAVKESFAQSVSVLAYPYYATMARTALELGGKIHDAVRVPVYFYAANDDGLNMAFLFADGKLASCRIHGENGIADWNGEAVVVSPYVLDVGEGADPDDVDASALAKLPLIDLKETAIYDEEEEPEHYMYSVPVQLWPNGWPDPKEVLGLGTWDSYQGYPVGYETAYVRV